MKQTDNFDEKNNGELEAGFYNACVEDDVALRDQIEAEMHERGFEVTYDGQHNPSWSYVRSE